jgi:hypothetical protein
MDDINDEAAALAGVAASEEQSTENDSSIADSKSKSNPEVARPLNESSLVTAKQAHRIVCAVARRLDSEYPSAWLLSVKEWPAGTVVVTCDYSEPPLESCVGYGPSGTAWPEHSAKNWFSLTGTICLDHTVILLGTLLHAIALTIMPKTKSRAEDLSWKDRFWELCDAILSLARRLIRPAERLDSEQVYAQWLRAQPRWLYVGGEAP